MVGGLGASDRWSSGWSMGPLTGGPISHVDFKKWQYHISLSLIYLDVTCRI